MGPSGTTEQGHFIVTLQIVTFWHLQGRCQRQLRLPLCSPDLPLWGGASRWAWGMRGSRGEGGTDWTFP